MSSVVYGWEECGRSACTFGDLFIKYKCQLCVKLCAASLFMHLFLWVFLVYAACVFLLLFCMNLCICRIFVCFNFIYSSKISCGIAQQVAGDATLDALYVQAEA
jgi:hypothetical protein